MGSGSTTNAKVEGGWRHLLDLWTVHGLMSHRTGRYYSSTTLLIIIGIEPSKRKRRLNLQGQKTPPCGDGPRLRSLLLSGDVGAEAPIRRGTRHPAHS